jgi:hypothetical protein
MQCSDHIRDLVARFVQEELSPTELDELHEHLEQCQDCRTELIAHTWLNQRFRAAGMFIEERSNEHLSDHDLILFAKATEYLPVAATAHFEAHLRVCESCRKAHEVAKTVRKHRTNMRGLAPFHGVFDPQGSKKVHRRPAFLAAAGVILILLVPAYFGTKELLNRTPQVSPSVSSIRSYTPYLLEQSNDRSFGAADAHVIYISGTDSSVSLFLRVPISMSPDFRYSLSVLDFKKTEIYRLPEIHEIDSVGRLLVQLPSASLSGGRYLLVVTERSNTDITHIVEFTYPFSIALREKSPY